MSLLQEIREKAKIKNKCIVLAEGEEERIIRAAEEIVEQKIARLILIGNKEVILSKAQKSLDGVTIIDPNTEDLTEYSNLLFELRKAKGMTMEQAVALAKKPLKLYVVQCDTRIQEIKEYTSLDKLRKDFKSATVKGSGGTDLKPCWDLLTTDKRFKGRVPDLIMIFTDGGLYGDTSYTKRNRRTMKHLCWCIIDNPSWNVYHPDQLTKTIHLSSKDIK